MITILHVGKVKNREIAWLIAEYAKRIEKYAKIRFSEVRDERVRREKARELEGERINACRKDGFVVALDPSGKECTSIELSSIIKDRNVTFIIGGPTGLDRSVLASSDLALSLSRMTFPHEMAQLILLEQVYRAFTILNNEEYHK